MKESLKLGTRNVAIDPDSEADALLEPGRRTVDAVNHGIYMAAVSAINRIYSEVCDQQGVALPMLLTGGCARGVARGSGAPCCLARHGVWRPRSHISADLRRARRQDVGCAAGAGAGFVGKNSRRACILHAALTECSAFQSRCSRVAALIG